MPTTDRRQFLASSLGSVAALSLGQSLFGQEKKAAKAKPAEKPPEVSGDPLASLFLTWQQDPTTTMTIQWVGAESASESAIRVAPFAGGEWQDAKTITKPYPNTELKVSRCELTGLSPDTEYKFQIGAGGKDFRFRTMPAKATNTIQWVSGGDAGIGEHAIGTNVIAAKQEHSDARRDWQS
jgi:acid phosphatase type 7